ncbi:MAG: beta-galactosidase [Chloroflexi bacterium]|nr:beta-galactosidase [Chloroflexota bacterium]MCY4246079.1 beta-galactosidase [Chloroflexota bacterium]
MIIWRARIASQRWWLARLCLLLAVAGLAGAVAWRSQSTQRDPFLASAITDAPFASLTYGVQAFLWWDENAAGKSLDLVRLMSFSHVKQVFAWRDIEPLPGEWRWSKADRILDAAERRELRLVARLGQVPDWAKAQSHEAETDGPPLDMALWARYCERVAQRYKGRIAAYQIWNEPNLSREWGGNMPDPAAFVELLAACSSVIRRIDPQAVLISAGLAPTGTNDASAMPDDIYFDHMYRNNFQMHIDVVGVHAPGFAPPEIGPDDPQALRRWFTFRRVEDLRKIMLRHDDAARQMAILEFGYTTDTANPDYAWFGVTEAAQAELILRAYDYVIAHWRRWVGLMILIYLPDPAWQPSDEEYWWSVIEPSTGDARRAYIEVANMRKVCGEFVIPARAPDSPAALGLAKAPICP